MKLAPSHANCPSRTKPTKAQRCASQQNWLANDAVGHKQTSRRDLDRVRVRFTPQSGHARLASTCPLSAISGLMQCIKEIGADGLVGPGE
jgi:hypothetical protein